jgi:hypothetical protein
MFNDKDKAELLLRKGFDRSLKLRNSIFLLSRYYKYLDLSESECLEKVSEWIETQKGHLAYEKIKKQKAEVVQIVYDGDYGFTDKVSVNIYLAEMKAINKLQTKGERKIAFALLYLSKVLRRDDDDVFYCKYEILSDVSGMNINQILIIINKLEHSGLLNIISRNEYKKTFDPNDKNTPDDERVKSLVYKYPNRYKVTFPKGKKQIITIGDIDKLEENFVTAYKICMNEYKFKVTYRFKNYINKSIETYSKNKETAN